MQKENFFSLCIFCSFPIYREILPCCFPVSSHVPWFSPIYTRLNFSLLSFETFLTIRQNSLYVTVCMFARSSYQGYFIHSLSTLHYCNAPSLTTRLTGDYRDRTYTGKCGPALLDTRNKKDCTTVQSARERLRSNKLLAARWAISSPSVLLYCSTSLLLPISHLS